MKEFQRTGWNWRIMQQEESVVLTLCFLYRLIFKNSELTVVLCEIRNKQYYQRSTCGGSRPEVSLYGAVAEPIPQRNWWTSENKGHVSGESLSNKMMYVWTIS